MHSLGQVRCWPCLQLVRSPRLLWRLDQGSARRANDVSRDVDISSTSLYCMDTVRQRDYEGYLCALLMPSEARRAVFALKAFNVELSQIRDMVTDCTLGKLRMQFWHETLERIYTNIPPAQPVAMELWQAKGCCGRSPRLSLPQWGCVLFQVPFSFHIEPKAVKQHKLTKQWLSRIIQSREANINDHAFKSLQDLETYSEATQTSLLFLTLESLDVRNVNADHAASHVGKALGIFTCLRSVPYNASHRRVQLPIDICMAHGASQEDILRRRHERAIRDVVFDLASQAHVHLQHAKSLQKNVPKAARVAFIQTVLVEDYLKRVRKVDFDVFHPSLQLRNPLLPFWMYWRSWQKSY